VLEYAERSHSELDSIEHSEERLNELREKETELLRNIGELAERISHVRVQIGQKLGQRVVEELADLKMERTQFEVRITQSDDPEGCFVDDRRLAFDSTGIDSIEFLLSANPGEPLRPLVKVASGGETARIMLALKRVLAQVDQTPTLIFDEIDQGIGGRVGGIVGEKLGRSRGAQVMVHHCRSLQARRCIIALKVASTRTTQAHRGRRGRRGRTAAMLRHGEAASRRPRPVRAPVEHKSGQKIAVVEQLNGCPRLEIPGRR
jgi:DNA repair protein RecN (Recombination protein N)